MCVESPPAGKSVSLIYEAAGTQNAGTSSHGERYTAALALYFGFILPLSTPCMTRKLQNKLQNKNVVRRAGWVSRLPGEQLLGRDRAEE